MNATMDCPGCGAPEGYPPAGPCLDHGTMTAVAGQPPEDSSLTSRSNSARIEAIRRGEALSPVPVSEPHWYLTSLDRGCVLCGKGEDVRIRMPGKRPVDPRDRYLDDGSDYACGSHFA